MLGLFNAMALPKGLGYSYKYLNSLILLKHFYIYKVGYLVNKTIKSSISHALYIKYLDNLKYNKYILSYNNKF